ncbi:MAG: hypothetical protein K6G09_02435 [Treponema sp.]|nr:hypothetical protein [Treponema sp.]
MIVVLTLSVLKVTVSFDLSDSTSVTFLWPFAESGKSYTLNAYLRGDRTKSKETVTFKTDSVSTTITKYNEDYLKSKLVLIALSV